MSPYICTAITASGATGVQVIFFEPWGAKTMEHIGSAHTSEDLAGLKEKAQCLIHGEQMSLDLGVDITPAGTESADAPVPAIGERAGHLTDAFVGVYRLLRLDVATSHDQVFQHLVMARIETGLGRKHSMSPVCASPVKPRSNAACPVMPPPPSRTGLPRRVRRMSASGPESWSCIT